MDLNDKLREENQHLSRRVKELSDQSSKENSEKQQIQISKAKQLIEQRLKDMNKQ